MKLKDHLTSDLIKVRKKYICQKFSFKSFLLRFDLVKWILCKKREQESTLVHMNFKTLKHFSTAFFMQIPIFLFSFRIQGERKFVRNS